MIIYHSNIFSTSGTTHNKLEDLLPEEAKYLLKKRRRGKQFIKSKIHRRLGLRSTTSKEDREENQNSNEAEVNNMDTEAFVNGSNNDIAAAPSCDTDDWNPTVIKVESCAKKHIAGNIRNIFDSDNSD